MAKSRRPQLPAERPGQPSSPRGGRLVITEHHEGPIPDPLTVARYADSYPDAPQIIFEMAQLEQAQRHFMERRRLAIIDRGQWFAFIFLMVSLLAAYMLVLGGFETAALVAVIGVAAPAALAFLYLRRDAVKEGKAEPPAE